MGGVARSHSFAMLSVCGHAHKSGHARERILGGQHFVDLTLEMAKRGHDVQAICHRDFRAAKELHGVANLCVEPIAVMGSWDVFAARRLSKLIGLFRANVVHAHLGRAAHLCARGAREWDVRLVTNSHNYINL